MSTVKTNLIKTAFKVSIKSELIYMIAPSFFILVALTTLISSFNPNLWFIPSIGTLLFFPILMNALRCYEEKSEFKLPPVSLIINKSWRVFIVNCITLPMILLGCILFIFPGLYLGKNYIYTGLISERERIGPLESMRKSKLLSKQNGWKLLFFTLVSVFILVIPYFIIFPNVIYPDPFASPGLFQIIVELAFCWFGNVVLNSLLFYGYKEAINESSNS